MKKESSKKSNEIQKIVSTAFDKIKDSEKEHKAELEPIKIEHSNEVEMLIFRNFTFIKIKNF